jgi:hypothetical protein
MTGSFGFSFDELESLHLPGDYLVLSPDSIVRSSRGSTRSRGKIGAASESTQYSGSLPVDGRQSGTGFDTRVQE